MTYLWSEFPNPLGYWLIHNNFHFASIFLFGDGELQVLSQQEGGAAFHHPDPAVHADEGGAGPVQEEQQDHGFQPTPTQRAHADRGQLFSVHRWNPFNKGEFLCFFRGCQFIVQGAGQRVLTMCPKILACLSHCKLRQGSLSGNPGAFNKTRWSLLTTLARLMCLPSAFLILQVGEGVRGKMRETKRFAWLLKKSLLTKKSFNQPIISAKLKTNKLTWPPGPSERQCGRFITLLVTPASGLNMPQLGCQLCGPADASHPHCLSLTAACGSVFGGVTELCFCFLTC